MQGSRNIDILMHIRDYCAEINHTMDTFGRDYDIFVSNSIYQNAVALCVLQIGELTTHFTDEFKSAYNKVPWNQIKAVQENKVYNVPVGFVGFEQTCSASALFIYSQANQIYPDLFDFDLVTLTQECLQKYFDYTLTDDAAQNLLDGYFKDGSLMME